MNVRVILLVVLIVVGVALSVMLVRREPVEEGEALIRKVAPVSEAPPVEMPPAPESPAVVETPVEPVAQPADLSFLQGLLPSANKGMAAKDGSITGVVVDANDAPVRDATVTLTGVGPDLSMEKMQELMKDEVDFESFAEKRQEIDRVQTGSDGAFAFESLPMKNYEVKAEYRDQVATQAAMVMPFMPASTLRLKLTNRGAIEGRVLNERGLAVAGAKVSAQKKGNFDPFNMGGKTTGADGAFVFDDLEEGVWVLTVRADDYPPLESEPIATGGIPVTLTLEKGGAIAGVVKHINTGEPIAGIRLSLSAMGESGYDMRSVTTGADGTFAQEGLWPTEYEIKGHSDRYVLEDKDVKVQAPAAGLPAANVTLKAGEGGVVRGHVVNAKTQEGIAGVTVHGQLEGEYSFGSQGAKTDADGAFELTNVMPGTVRLNIGEGDGFMGMNMMPTRRTDVRVEVALGAVVENVEIAIEPGAEVAGKVIGKDGKPLAGAIVMAMDFSEIAQSAVDSFGGADGADVDPQAMMDSFPIPKGPAMLGADGTFTIAGIDSASVTLMVMSMTDIRSMENGPMMFGPYEVPEGGLSDLTLDANEASSMESIMEAMTGMSMADIEASMEGIEESEHVLEESEEVYAP